MGNDVCFQVFFFFLVDTSEAGEGRASMEVRGPTSQPSVSLLETDKPGKMEAVFEAVEAGVHLVSIDFNQQPILDSPFECLVLDLSDVTADFGDLDRYVKVGESCAVTLRTAGIDPEEFKVGLKDEQGAEVPVEIQQRDDDRADVILTPQRVGRHVLMVTHGHDDDIVRGFPREFVAVDPSRALLTSSTSTCFVGDTAHFSGKNILHPGNLLVCFIPF